MLQMQWRCQWIIQLGKQEKKASPQPLSEGEGSSRGDVPNGKLVRILGDGNDKQ